ncbi:hypothetical protein K469DRAFT_747301 [Zopfia rhizophila CBS 207.26]|uniref:Uncharacterized protein n=1 Tax=Zopfia rhizophila CBS 207.26 TaxID=1314779 RepID=A0A6A6EH94_9PEZI|nr:hypothetical protein K469DRAFT_747301 [Zopfia rhizophila CBS 207.26]
MNDPDTRDRTLEDQKVGFLSTSVGTPQLGSSHRVRSSRSDVTIVKNSEYLGINRVIKAPRTLITEVKLSWWDALKGLFFGIYIKPVEVDDVDVEIFDHDCPFIRTINVFPRENSAREQHQQAQCYFDTGCLQGNFVSLDFARKLGYTAIGKLKAREQNGRTSATGLMPERAILLSWYHSASAQVFRNMRFLVAGNASFDLIIGTRSIVKYNLVSPPNLHVTFDHDNSFNHNLCPFIQPINVFPRENSTRKQDQQARCIFDTRCLQGNFMSLDFARKLGYTEFRKLKAREQNGRTSATELMPEGAILLSWYHSASTQLFRNMRFLVTRNASFDLIIGTRSIVKYNLVSPLNLHVTIDHDLINHESTRRLDSTISFRSSPETLRALSRYQVSRTILRNLVAPSQEPRRLTA